MSKSDTADNWSRSRAFLLMLWYSSNAVEAIFLERKWHVLVRPAVHLQEKCYSVSVSCARSLAQPHCCGTKLFYRVKRTAPVDSTVDQSDGHRPQDGVEKQDHARRKDQEIDHAEFA